MVQHYTAVSAAIKDKMDLAIGVAVGSSMQIALHSYPIDDAPRMVYTRGHVVVLQHFRNMHTLHCRDVDYLIFDVG